MNDKPVVEPPPPAPPPTPPPRPMPLQMPKPAAGDRVRKSDDRDVETPGRQRPR